jgi:hypothetical protein
LLEQGTGLNQQRRKLERDIQFFLLTGNSCYLKVSFVGRIKELKGAEQMSLITPTFKRMLLAAMAVCVVSASAVHASGSNSSVNSKRNNNGHNTGGKGNGHGGYAAPELDSSALADSAAVLVGFLLLERHRRREIRA